jgi:hypothetical protein
LLEFTGNGPMLEFVECILNEKSLIKSSRKHSFWESVMNPGIGIGISALIGTGVYLMAKELESGESVEISARKAFYKRIGLWLAETLGSTGTLFVFGLIVAACIFWAYRKLKNPGEQIEYNG